MPFRCISILSHRCLVSVTQPCQRTNMELRWTAGSTGARQLGGGPARAALTEAVESASAMCAGMPPGQRCWPWQQAGGASKEGTRLAELAGAIFQVESVALLRLPDKNAKAFVRGLRMAGRQVVEIFLTKAGAVPALEELTGAEWAVQVHGGPWDGHERVVDVRSSRWCAYGAEDHSMEVGKPREVHPAAMQAVQRMASRRVPWRTPHTYEQDGKLKLTEQAEEWLAKETERRERLVEEVRDAADQGNFEVKTPLRAKWRLAQSDEMRKWPDGNESYRLAPGDGLVERELEGRWVPVVPDGIIEGGTLSWRRWVFLQTHVGVFGGHKLLD